MITELSLNFHRRARIWLDELPDALFTPEQSLEELLQPATPDIAGARQAAAELLVPKGAIAMYGLLGAEFIPNSSGALRVRVELGIDKRKGYASSLVLKSETATVGLEKEIGGTVLKAAVSELTRASLLPAGDLVFSRAVQGQVGSNQWLFEQLGSIVTKLILLQNRKPGTEELLELF